MPELETKEQALAYLAEYSPSRRFALMPFEYGWVVLPQLPPEQARSAMSVGLGKLVLDRETGKLYTYPSWSIPMVVEAFTEMKQTGANRAGRQVYPYQQRIDVKRIGEDEVTVEYEMTVTSLTDPPEPTQRRAVTLQKNSGLYTPTDSTAALANSLIRWVAKSQQGAWPEEATTQR